MTEVNWIWVVLSSAAVGAAVKGVLDLIVSIYGSKGQFKRDRANVAKMIYNTPSASTDDKVEECVKRWGRIYRLLDAEFKKNK